MSAINRLRCRLGIHEWRSGICFYCGKKACSSGVGGSAKASASPAPVIPARVAETQALADHAPVRPSPPRASATPLSPPPQVKDTAASPWRLGEVVLDLYEVKEVFESGGMGLVYRVHHRGWNVELAVKSPRAEQFRTDEQRRRFEAEIDAWIALGLHPHIVSCYYVRTLGGVPRVFAEYVTGGTLDAWIKDRRLYAGGREAAQERLLDVALQIAWAMGYAHTQGSGLVHQDLKPLNVLMTPEGTAKVTDFGLAQARGRAGASEAATDGRTVYVAGCGLLTPAYASPEQYAQGQGAALSRKSDLWSWAVTVLELYLGGLPWDPRIPGHVALAHGLEGYLKSGAQDPQIPPLPRALQVLLRDCLKPNPAERPADFAAVAERLVEIYRDVVGRDYPRVPPVPAELQANALSNRAISMLDLGRDTEARALFERALAQEPGHPQATYNWGLVRWRRGEITDLDLVQQLEQAQADRPGNWRPPYLLGLLHLERRDAAGALATLTAAQNLADRPEIRAALELARRIPTSAGNCLAKLEGHTDAVWSVALGADGHCALSGSGDKTLRLWDLDSGQCLRILRGHTNTVWSVDLSADCRLALSGSVDNTLRLWDLDKGRCFGTLDGYTGALSADGRRALSVSEDKTLRLWDLDRRQCLRTLEGHTDFVRSVVLSADGRLALSGSEDATLRFWDLDGGACLRVMEGSPSALSPVTVSADGRRSLSEYNGSLRLWDLDTGGILRTLRKHSNRMDVHVTSVALDGNSRRALSGNTDNTLCLWDLDEGQCLRTLEGHTGSVHSVALSADGRHALSGGSDRTLRLWDTGAWLEDAPALRGHLVVSKPADTTALLALQRQWREILTQADAALAADLWPDAWRLAGQAGALPGYRFDAGVLQRAHRAGWRGGVRCGLRSVRCQTTLEGHTSAVTSVALSADGHLALSGSADQTLRLWATDSGEYLRVLEGHTGGVTSLALGADERRALSGSMDQTLRWWDLDTGQRLRTLTGHTDHVWSVALSADGRRALSGSGDQTLRLWELASGRCARILDGHNGEVFSVALGSDGHWALSGSEDKTLRLWDLDTGECLRILEGHTDHVRSVILSADRRRALSGSADQTLRLWELDSGLCVRTLNGHSGTVFSVALSADGRLALSGSADQTLRLWDLDTGECLRILEGHAAWVFSVALCADGRWALSGSVDETLRLWEFELDYAFPEPQDWDEGARPYLRNFLVLHAPEATAGSPTGSGPPTWDEAAWEQLQHTLRDVGYGWLRPEGVRRELQRMAKQWPLVAGSVAHEQPLMTGQELAGPQHLDRADRKVGRNEPCPCGSGKKYKHCHGKAA